MNQQKQAYLELHIAVFLFGFTAILGDLINLSALVVVWWRVLLTSISLFFLIRFGKTLKGLPRSLILKYMGIGILVGLHWICFFGAIKYANASITLVCMATTSFFTAILEPLFLSKKLKWYELGLGLIIIPGMAMIANSAAVSMMMGIWIGLLSALLAAIFSILNKKLVDEADPMTITFIELSSAWIFICLLLPFYLSANKEAIFWPSWSDFGYLCVLAFLCTTLAYVLALRALKHLSAFTANLTINLEPVYGVALAILLLAEDKELNTGFYIGYVVILLAVFSYPFIKKRFEKLDQEVV